MVRYHIAIFFRCFFLLLLHSWTKNATCFSDRSLLKFTNNNESGKDKGNAQLVLKNHDLDHLHMMKWKGAKHVPCSF